MIKEVLYTGQTTGLGVAEFTSAVLVDTNLPEDRDNYQRLLNTLSKGYWAKCRITVVKETPMLRFTICFEHYDGRRKVFTERTEVTVHTSDVEKRSLFYAKMLKVFGENSWVEPLGIV